MLSNKNKVKNKEDVFLFTFICHIWEKELTSAAKETEPKDLKEN